MPPGEQRVPQRVGDVLGQRLQPGVDVAGQQLGQVGVAERALPDVLDQGVPRGRAPQIGQLLGGLLDGQPGQRQVDHAGHPQHVGQPAVQDMSVGDALVAVGHQQRHRLLPGSGDEVGERVEGADVGPLKVVDGEDDGAFLGEPGHRAVDRVQGAAGGVGSPVDAVQRGQVQALHRVPLGAPALERGDEREVGRRRGAEVQATGPQHRVSPGPGPVRDRADEAGLPHAGLTVHQDGARYSAGGPPDHLAKELLLPGSTGDAGRLAPLESTHAPTVQRTPAAVSRFSGQV